MNEINIICAADLHLGKQVTGNNPENIRSYVIQAWENLIEQCIHYKVDALLIAGDLVDKDNLFFPMAGVFKKGVLKLQENRIPVIAVAGNHDSEVLDKLNKALDISSFHLLGTKKEQPWERFSLKINNRTLHIDGFSFTKREVTDNPLANTKFEAVSNQDVLIGLLHCDVDVTGSKYAPVRHSDFDNYPHHAWVLGHVHIPKEIRKESPFVFYCGSLQGLDIGRSECGPRGAWKLTVNARGTVTSKFLPLAPLRWEHVEVDLSELSLEDWENQVLKRIEARLVLIELQEHIEVVGIRLTFVGQTKIYRELRQNLTKIQLQEYADFKSESRRIPYFIESIKNNTRPVLDLRSFADQRNILGSFARNLLQIQEDQSSFELIYNKLKERFERDPQMKLCEEFMLSPKDYQDLYFAQGYELLDQLLKQK